MLSPPKPLDKIQPNLVCESLMNGACNGKFLCGPAIWGPGEGSKGQISFISITKSISKIFIPNFVCVLTNERYKTYQTRFSFCCLGNAPGVGLWGAGGAKVVKNLFLSSDSFTILGLWVLGLATSNINESPLQTNKSITLFLMTSLQYYCIPGLAEIKTYTQKMQDAQVTKSLFKHCHVAYQINEDDEQNRMQVKFSS